MEQRQVKFRPFHGILIVAMLALTVVLYVFKDKIGPSNESDKYDMFVEAQATVISKEVERGRRGSTDVIHVQFRDQEGVLRTAKIYDNHLLSVPTGEEITIYYNPEFPKEARSEARYKEIMGIK